MVDNAATALKRQRAPDKEIRLSTRVEDDSLKLVIRDNGSGMSEDELDNIWTPFYSKFPEHAGLGLVLCEKIIANHGAACRSPRSRANSASSRSLFPCRENPAQKQKKSADKDPRSQS